MPISQLSAQLLAAVAMEPPVDLSADAVRDEKAKLLRSIRLFTSESVKGMRAEVVLI